MYCNKCGKQIVDDSIFCNFCGAKVEILPQDGVEVQAAQYSQPAQPVVPSATEQARQRVSLKETLVKQACKDIIEKRLKSPATVNYAVMDITDEDKYGRYCLYVELDSQNSFGALVRSKYRVVLQAVYTDGTYSAFSEAVLPVSFINTEENIKKLNKWNTKAYELGLFERV